MDFTKEWMYEKCHLVQLPTQEKVTTALPAFNKFISQKQVSGHVHLGAHCGYACYIEAGKFTSSFR